MFDIDDVNDFSEVPLDDWLSIMEVGDYWTDRECTELSVSCGDCQSAITDALHSDPFGILCLECARRAVRDAISEGKRLAKDVRLTRIPEPFVVREAWRCTPEDYALGNVASYSPSSHRAWIRHCCTNYDELIAPLCRESSFDSCIYGVIRKRVDEIVDEAYREDLGDDLVV